MHLLWRRYSRSGVAPTWFYSVLALGFAAIVVWAIVARDWLVAVIAALMIAAALGARQLARLIVRNEREGTSK